MSKSRFMNTKETPGSSEAMPLFPLNATSAPPPPIKLKDSKLTSSTTPSPSSSAWTTTKRSLTNSKASRSGGHQPKASLSSGLHFRTEAMKRSGRLTCKREHRDIITNDYLQHVLDEGKAIEVKTRQQKLNTNNKTDNYGRIMWSHIIFEHPSTFDTLAMDPKKKKDILDDLMTFSKSKDYV